MPDQIRCASFYLDGLIWDPAAGLCSASVLACDETYAPIVIGDEGGGLFHAPTLVELWRKATATVVLGIPDPDFPRIQALSSTSLAEGCSWGGSFDLEDAVWTIGLMDEVRGKWLDHHEGPTLEAALERALEALDRNWLARMRHGWQREPWIDRAAESVASGVPAAAIL